MLLPTVQKRCVAAVFAAFLGLLAAGPAQAAPAPKLKSAYPVDRDRDGHVDGVSLTLVEGGPRWLRRQGAVRHSVRGYRVTKVGGRSGRRSTCDVAERPRMRHGRVGPRLVPRGRRGTAPIKTLRGKRTVRRTSSTCAASISRSRESPARSRSTPTATLTSTACG